MKLKINNKFFTLIRGQIIILPLLFFCASCAPFSKELMRQVDESITYQDVKKDISAYIGKQVLWGGVIIETKNRPEETIIVVRQTELDYERRPVDLHQSSGRFLVKYQDFLDPAIFQAGREISVVGEVTGLEKIPVEGITLTVPVILAKEIKLWEKAPKYIYVYPWYGHFYFYYHYPYHYHHYYYWRPYRPYR